MSSLSIFDLCLNFGLPKDFCFQFSIFNLAVDFSLCLNSGLPICVWYTGMCEFRTTNLRLVYRNVRIPDYQSAVGIPECENSGLPISVWYTGMCEFRTTKPKNIFRLRFFRAPVII